MLPNHKIMSILANLLGLWKLSCFVMTAPKEEQLRNFQRALCASHARKSLVKGERFIRRLHGKHARKSNHVNFNTYLCVSCQPLSLVKLPFFQNARSLWHHGLVATLCYRAFFGPTEMVFVTWKIGHSATRASDPTSQQVKHTSYWSESSNFYLVILDMFGIPIMMSNLEAFKCWV